MLASQELTITLPPKQLGAGAAPHQSYATVPHYSGPIKDRRPTLLEATEAEACEIPSGIEPRHVGPVRLMDAVPPRRRLSMYFTSWRSQPFPLSTLIRLESIASAS